MVSCSHSGDRVVVEPLDGSAGESFAHPFTMQREDDVRLTEIEPFLNQLGDEARALAMQHFRTEIDVETKSDATPVTKADRAIERRLREMIHRATRPMSSSARRRAGALRTAYAG